MADFTALKTAIQTYIKQNGNEEITGNILQEVLLSVVTTLGDGAINDLITALGNEVTARQQADGTLQQNITNEATARGNADTALSNRLGSTITAENTAAAQIGAEAEAREAADTALQGLIDGITGNIENGYVYAGIATPSTTPVTGKVFYLALTAGTYTNFGSTVVSQGINILKYNGSAWSLDAFIGIDDTPTPNSPKFVKSGGTFDSIMTDGSAFDISAYFASGGTLATYADLSAALTALNTLSASYKRGGMSIKFVQSSDNKYVQYRLMSDTWSTVVANWQGVDDAPTAGSQNLVKSGGVAKINNIPKGFETKGTIAGNSSLSLPNSYVRLNTTISGGIVFSGNFEGIEIGRESNAYDSYVEINNTTINVYNSNSAGNFTLESTLTHGLDISNFLNVSINNNGVSSITINTLSGSFSGEIPWRGGGSPYIRNKSANPVSGTLSFCCNRIDADVWLFHDSYGLYFSQASWLYYLIQDGYSGLLEDGQTGYTADNTYRLFTQDLSLFKPKYVVWALGMNDVADSDSSTPNGVWRAATEKVIADCNKIGVTIILCTIPNIPSKLHEGKNNWIRNSGYRYIDISAAVGSQIDGTWYNGLLSGDNVHPTALGAEAIANYVLTEFPEITLNNEVEQVREKYIANEHFDSIDSYQKFLTANIGLDITEANRAYVRGDVILTSKDVQEGDVLMVSMVVTGTVGLGMFVTGQTSPVFARDITQAFTYVIPSGFSNCRVYTGTGSIQFNYFKVKGIANRTIVATQNADRQDVFSVKSAIGLNFVDTTKAYRRNDVVFTKNDARAGDVLHMVLNYNDSSTTLVLYSDTNTVLVSYAKPSNANSRTVDYTIPSNFDRAVVLWGSGTIILSECYIKNITNRELKSAIKDRTGIYVAPSEGLDGIKSAIIRLAQAGSKGKIILGIGEYSGTSAVSFYEYISSSVGNVYTNGIIIEGQGYGTVLNRTTGASEIQLNDSISDNIIVRNLRVMHGIAANNSTSNNRNISFEEVWINEAYYDKYQIVGSNIVNIGADYYYKKFTAFQAAAAAYTAMPLEIHLYGHIKETSEIQQIQNTDTVFIGHNAILELDTPMARAISINTKNCKFKDIHFIKSGCGNYWDLAAVNVYSYDTIFENCIFENKSFSPTPFNQADFIVSAEDYRGSRRYGIEVSSSGYGKENKLVFINCKGIGSPYGFQNTRGFYILFGEPKLYNCVGIGGGIGEFGHGILSHRSSRPTLFNCIGYAGPMSYRKAAGIRVQCSGSPLLESCVGYGGCNKQYKSNGVSYATLHSKCVELGISDESFFYDGSNVNYDGLTLTSPDDGLNDTRISLLRSLSIEDLDIVELESNSEENYGIGLWAGQNKARLMNCCGYSGGGVGSIGLIMESYNEPTIVGGYYGVEDLTDLRYFVNDSNKNYMTFLPARLNEFSPYTVTGLTLLAGNYDYQEDDYIRIETVEETPIIVAEGKIRGLNINIVSTTKTDIGAGVKLKMYVINNGNIISIPNNSIRFQLFYNYNNLNSYALKVGSSAAPVINGTIFESADASDCVVNDSSKEDTLIHNCTIISRGNGKAITTSDKTKVLRLFNNAIKGAVDNDIQFATQQSVNGSNNYSI